MTMNDPRIGAPGALPETTISGAPFAYPNVTLIKLGGGYRAALDPFVHPNQEAILSELQAMVAAELSPKGDTPAASRKRRAQEVVVQDEQQVNE